MALSSEPLEVVAAYYADPSLSFQPAVLPDPVRQAEIIDEYKFWGTPITYLFDREGRLVRVRVGVFDSEGLQEFLAASKDL